MKYTRRNDSVGIGRGRAHSAQPGCCRNHIVVLPGTGKKNFNFPDVETLVINALARLGPTPVLPKTKKKSRRKNKIASGWVPPIRSERDPDFIIPGLPENGVKIDSIVTRLPDDERAGKGLGPTLFVAAEGIRQVLHRGRFDAIIAERFDPLAGAVNWASSNMEPKYRPAIISLAGELGHLRSLYRQALPRVLSVLASQNPEASSQELQDAAVSLLDQELAEILMVLSIWTDAFGQRRDGMYKQLRAVTFVVEQAFQLFETGDLDEKCEDGQKCRPKLETGIFKTGNVFVVRFSPQGPATFPARGPIDAHVIDVPHDERDLIMLMLVLYTHEFRHDIFADVRGLEDELTKAVVTNVTDECKANASKYASGKVRIGRKSYDYIELLARLFADTIGEVDADISGGVLTVGPAFLYNVLMTFCAFNSRGRSIFTARETDRFLRTGSFYEFDEEGNPHFLPHPPDYLRMYIVAAALDEIGFPEEAEQCRALADQAVGVPIPDYITWEDVDGKSKSVIRISMADLKRIAPVVAKTLIRTKLQSLGGISMCDLTNWNRDRQAKVDLLTHNLMAGNAIVPTDMGDFYATYVAAAATMAYWGLTDGGTRVAPAIASVEKNALAMLDTVRERLTKPEAAKSGCGCGKEHHHPEPENVVPPVVAVPDPTDPAVQ